MVDLSIAMLVITREKSAIFPAQKPSLCHHLTAAFPTKSTMFTAGCSSYWIAIP